MNKLSILVIVAMVALSMSSGDYEYGTSRADLWLSRDYSRFDYGDYYGFLPNCFGGSGQFSYTYSYLPNGWSGYRNTFQVSDPRYYNGFYVPRTISNGRYQIGVKVYDRYYKVDTTRYLIVEKYEDDKWNFFLRDSYDNDYNRYSTYSPSWTYPSWSVIENYINDGDVYELRRIVDNCYKSGYSHDERYSFVMGINNRIEKYRMTYQDRYNTYLSDYDRLKGELTSYGSSRRYLGYNYDDDYVRYNIRGAYDRVYSDMSWSKKIYSSLSTVYDEFSQRCEKEYYNSRQVAYATPSYAQGVYSGYIDTVSFNSYCSSTYGVDAARYLSPYYTANSRIQLQNINYYSGDWNSRYGKSYTYGSNLYRDDFTCSYGSDSYYRTSSYGSSSYYGTITRITSNVIYCDYRGREVSLYLASCSALRSSTGYAYPRVGDRFLWNGVARNVGYGYNVYSALCA